MDTESWTAAQRKVREMVRARGRTSDGYGATPRGGAALPAAAPIEAPQPPEFQALGPTRTPGIAARKLIRRLVWRDLIEPQQEFNRQVVALLRRQTEQLATLSSRLEGAGGHDPEMSLDYLAFENRFRGSDDAIKSRQLTYVDHFSRCRAVLDIGCGRGEFLSALRDRGIEARGVDLDEDMVALSRQQGLRVDHRDAVSYLEEQDAGAFDGIFISQVVEHLTSGQLMTLLRAIGEKTQPGAVLIVETINPESLPVLMRWFWLDPTHVRLVHPETLQFMMEQAGFAIEAVNFTQAVPAEDLLPRLPHSELASPETIAYNDAVARVNQRLFGGLDYSVVGRR